MSSCERNPVFLLVMLVVFLSCGSDDREDCFDTSGVDYSGSAMKLLATEFIGNEYMKYYEIKISINIPKAAKVVFLMLLYFFSGLSNECFTDEPLSSFSRPQCCKFSLRVEANLKIFYLFSFKD